MSGLLHALTVLVWLVIIHHCACGILVSTTTYRRRADGVKVYWPDIKTGEIVRAKSGLLRVVRRVNDCGGKIYVFFTIKHCSWTGRCYTLYSTNELHHMGYRRIYRLFKLGDELDIEIEAEFNDRDRRKLTCCDVEGLA